MEITTLLPFSEQQSIVTILRVSNPPIPVSNILAINLFNRLVCKLARESYFGPAVMQRSTVYGCQDKPPLPKDKLEKLKKKHYFLFILNFDHPRRNLNQYGKQRQMQ